MFGVAFISLYRVQTILLDKLYNNLFRSVNESLIVFNDSTRCRGACDACARFTQFVKIQVKWGSICPPFEKSPRSHAFCVP